MNSAAEKKAFDILVLDLRNRSDLTDFFMICSGNSKVHVQSVVDAILDNCYQTHNKPLAIEGYSGGNWVVVDLGDLIDLNTIPGGSVKLARAFVDLVDLGEE